MAVDSVYIYFNKPLMPQVLEPTWWLLRVANKWRNLSNAVATAERVKIETTPGTFEAGSNRVWYNPLIPQLRDEDGLFVEPFVFEVTVVP